MLIHTVSVPLHTISSMSPLDVPLADSLSGSTRGPEAQCHPEASSASVRSISTFSCIFVERLVLVLSVPIISCWSFFPAGHLIFTIERRQLLTKVCNLLVMFFVTRQVSDPYRRTDLTFVLKIRILLLMLSDEDFHIGFRLINVFLAFPILDLTSSSVPRVVETMLGG